MTAISQKCQYALRAVLELAKRPGKSLTTIAEIAAAQAIPPRFLEQILAQLRQTGYVESRRGAEGGYQLSVSPRMLTAGEIIRSIEGRIAPVKCVEGNGETSCPLHENCAFMSMWARARDAVAAVFDGTTFQDLIEEQQAAVGKGAASYCI